jgi:penicillin-binding protein-related factor A (putative recombinase)
MNVISEKQIDAMSKVKRQAVLSVAHVFSATLNQYHFINTPCLSNFIVRPAGQRMYVGVC